jgi:hypothetical protein
MSDNLFARLASTPRMELTESEEQGAIAEARDGNNDAALQLLANYLPLLKSVVGDRYRQAQARPAQARSSLLDDLHSASMEAFFAAIRDFDRLVSPRLGAVLKVQLQSYLYVEVGSTLGVEIPNTSRKRFTQLMKLADGDAALAREMAPAHGMTAETFDAVQRAFEINYGRSLTDEVGSGAPTIGNPNSRGKSATSYASVESVVVSPLAEQPLVDVENVFMARRALDALDPTERLVVEALYGMDGEVQSEREAAASLGIARSTLQRTHTRALAKMHSQIA